MESDPINIEQFEGVKLAKIAAGQNHGVAICEEGELYMVRCGMPCVHVVANSGSVV